MKTAYELEKDTEDFISHLKNRQRFSCNGFKINKKDNNTWEILDKDKRLIKQCKSELEVLKTFFLQLSVNNEE